MQGIEAEITLTATINQKQKLAKMRPHWGIYPKREKKRTIHGVLVTLLQASSS